MSDALLVLADGSVFHGRRVGAAGRADGEVVFNTSMTGYQEMLTDPSYAGQLLTLTYPLIGNYGVDAAVEESGKIQPAGLIVHEASAIASHIRSQGLLQQYLEARGVVAIDGVDTRAVTRIRFGVPSSGAAVTVSVPFVRPTSSGSCCEAAQAGVRASAPSAAAASRNGCRARTIHCHGG